VVLRTPAIGVRQNALLMARGPRISVMVISAAAIRNPAYGFGLSGLLTIYLFNYLTINGLVGGWLAPCTPLIKMKWELRKSKVGLLN